MGILLHVIELGYLVLSLYEEISPDEKLGEVTVFAAQITDPETKDSPVLKVYCVSSIFSKELSKGHHTFLFAFGYTHNEAVEFYNLAVHYYNNKSLMSSHQRSWDFVWRSVNVDVDNTDFAKTVKSSLFFILSAFPHFALENPDLENYPFDFYGVSPGSLGNGSDGEDYWGHVFWDQDLWMLPGVMLLFPQLDRSDVCPGAIYAKYQQHITACVVYAIRQYVYVTGSWDILTKDGAWDIVKETADYWVSRVEWDGSNFVIDHVMDPDEYHYNVNNSCFTNAAARLNLLFAIEAAEKLGKIPDPRWETVSQEKQGIKIPFDDKLRYHPEYDGYTQGTLIKQASVVLLGYPLGVSMDPDVRRNDIIEYEKCTDRGPGMTYSMYSIGMLELGQLDTAAELFKIAQR
ncbi:protein-glucosylgalactosylhydroxylysine glucosidase-like [Bolinopsis microptera]|uniref:protein-glucosylgalactosylhydroxylysine glucosidase-like n=1 Tax=Bolinopsis microptera TaxID=2820187 RepID=UPI003079E3EF